MFSKATKTPSAAPQATPRKPTVASLVAADVLVRGDVMTVGDLHLDGAIEGDVKVARLTIGETGSVTGVIQAESVEIRGKVSGAVTARQVRLCATAVVDGDISHSELAIEVGAHFEGRSLIFQPPPEPLALVASAAE